MGGIEDWIDLLHALRAPELDDLFDPARRFRRLAQRFDGIGGREVLSARARVVQPARAGVRGARVLALDVPRQVRLVPGHELGLASERDAALTMGRALAIAWTHPALPTLEAWPRGETVGRALGGLFAHLGASPEQLEREGGLASRERRLVAERALALDVFSLLTRGACAEVRPHLGERSGQERAETALREAWGVELPPALAACLTAHLGPHPDAAARAERWVAPLFLALRERYDEDWWRNPRSAEPLRAACERGPSLEIEAWAEELDAPADGWARRLRERL
ncbi:MAG: hypothetical protein VYE22_12040 [Myxococcota bacterium]|nr:hypothetical protein [Myxococcota bacterium]